MGEGHSLLKTENRINIYNRYFGVKIVRDATNQEEIIVVPPL